MAGPDFQPGQYEFQCLHGMGEPLYEEVVGRGRAAAGRAASTRRSARTRPCSPTWCGACWRTAPTPPSSTASPTRRCRSRRWSPIRSRVGRGAMPVPARRIARIALPRDLFGAARANSAGLDLANEAALAGLAGRPARERRRRPGGPRRPAPMPDSADSRVRNPADRRDVVGHVGDGHGRRRRRRPSRARRRPPPAWAATPPAERAACLRRAADAFEAAHAGADRPDRARGRQVLRQRASPRCARRSTSCATTRPRPSGRSTRPHAPLGPVVCIARGISRCAIFTGQVAAALAAGNPVLAKPAEETPLIAAEAVRILHAAGVPRGRAAARCRAAARSARPWSATRGSRACCSPARPTSPRLHPAQPRRAADPRRRAGPAHRRDRRPERHGGRFLGARRAGGGRRDRLGLRFRRPALLGPAHPVPAGGDRRPDARDAEGRDARIAGRRSAPARRRCRAGDHRRSRRPHRRPRRGDARRAAFAVHQLPLPADTAARHLRAADADRDRPRRRRRAARCSARCCTCCATAAPISTGCSRRSTPPATA